MGLTISYAVRLRRKSDIPEFLAAARSRGRKLGWRVRRSGRVERAVELVPHRKSDSLVFEFTNSLSCEHFVKTNYAPIKTHTQIVDFLRAIRPLAKSLKVEDECDYWETGDKKLLKKHRDGFDRAMGKLRGRKTGPPVTLKLDAMTIDPSGKISVNPRPRIVVV